MEHVDAINLDAKAIEIVSNYIIKNPKRWIPLKIPECMHIDGNAWIYEDCSKDFGFDKDSVEIIWKCSFGYSAKYILICNSLRDVRMFLVDYRFDRTEQWHLVVYGALDSKIIKNTEKEK